MGSLLGSFKNQNIKSQTPYLHSKHNTKLFVPHPKKTVPDTENSNGLFTEEKGFGVLDLEIIVFPLTVNRIIFEHVSLQTTENYLDQIQESYKNLQF